MGVLSAIRKALSAVGEFDRKVVYGSDYKEKGAALARLNDINMRAKLLENEQKFQMIQKIREAGDRQQRQDKAAAFTQAATLGAAQDPQYDPNYQGVPSPGTGQNPDQIDPMNILHKGGEGVLPTEVPSFLAPDISPEDRPLLDKVVGKAQSNRVTKEFRDQQTFESGLGRGALNEELIRARIAKLEEDGGGNNDPGYSAVNGGIGVDEGGNFGGLVFDRRKGQYSFNAVPGFSPRGGGAPLGLRKEMVGVAKTYSNISDVLESIKGAMDILGPISGRVALGQKNWAGSEGLTPAQITALTMMDRATMMSAFDNGGKQLTGIERETFINQFPQASDTIEAVYAKAALLQRLLKKEAKKTKGAFTPAEAALFGFKDMGAVLDEDAPQGQPAPGGKPPLADWLKSRPATPGKQ